MWYLNVSIPDLAPLLTLVGVSEDIRVGGKYLSSHVHVNFTIHEVYIKIDLISVMDSNSSAAICHLGKKMGIN